MKIAMEWKPASIESVRGIVHDDLATCDQKQVAAFEAYRVEPRLAPIVRYGKLENVVVIAQKENQVIYWEDIEEGFGSRQSARMAEFSSRIATRMIWVLRSMRGLHDVASLLHDSRVTLFSCHPVTAYAT